MRPLEKIVDAGQGVLTHPVSVRALRTCRRAPDKLGHRPQYLERRQENVSRVSERG